MGLSEDVQALQDAANTVVTAVETVVNDVESQTPTEDPVWTAVKAALVDGGWAAPTAPVVAAEAPADTSETPSE